MDKCTKKKWFIGIDISKDNLDLGALHKEKINAFKKKKISNDIEGFESMLSWMRSNGIKGSEAIFCMEHTGTYGLLLFAWLSQKELDFSVVPGLQIKKSLGMTRGKNDRIDACRIASYAFEKKEKLVLYQLPTQKILQIKQKLTYRDQLVKITTSFKNSIKPHRQYELVTKTSDVSAAIEIKIKSFEAEIQSLEKEIKSIIKSDESLHKNYKMAISVKGIGLIITAAMIVSTNNFQSFNDGRAYACYVGNAPFPEESGTSIKHKAKTSHLANKNIRRLLANGANSAATNDPEIKDYYWRKREEGKDHKLIINAISCKLINRVFATVKRGTPYVSMYSQNFNKKNLVVS